MPTSPHILEQHVCVYDETTVADVGEADVTRLYAQWETRAHRALHTVTKLLYLLNRNTDVMWLKQSRVLVLQPTVRVNPL